MNDQLHPISKARVPHVTDPSESTVHRFGPALREACNDLSFTEEEAIAIDLAGLDDKRRNGYDARRVAVAAQIEADRDLAREQGRL